MSKDERSLMRVEKQYSAGENYETSYKTIGKDTKSVKLIYKVYYIQFKIGEKREKSIV